MRRVNWPLRSEVVRLTLMVFVVSAFVAALLGVFDFVFSRALFFADTFFSRGSQPPIPFTPEGALPDLEIPVEGSQQEPTIQIAPETSEEPSAQ